MPAFFVIASTAYSINSLHVPLSQSLLCPLLPLYPITLVQFFCSLFHPIPLVHPRNSPPYSSFPRVCVHVRRMCVCECLRLLVRVCAFARDVGVRERACMYVLYVFMCV